MEKLIVILVVLAVLNYMGKSKKKPATGKQAGRPAVPPAAKPAEAPKPAPVQTTMLGDPVGDMRPQQMIPEPMILEPMVAAQPARPGSLPGRSMEGVDPCHPREAETMKRRLQTHAYAQESREEDEEALLPELTPEHLRQAFVMSEVLKRPCERRQYP